MNRAAYLFLVLVVALGAALAGYRFSGGDAADAAAPRGDAGRLLGLTLPDLENRPQALAQWRGQVLVVNYWATWCPPCRREMPAFARLARKYADRGVRFVGIAIDDADKVRAYARATDIPYALLMGDNATLDLTAPMGNPTLALPFTVVLDRQGGTVFRQPGLVNEAELEAVLAKQAAPR